MRILSYNCCRKTGGANISRLISVSWLNSRNLMVEKKCISDVKGEVVRKKIRKGTREKVRGSVKTAIGIEILQLLQLWRREEHIVVDGGNFIVAQHPAMKKC